MTTKGGNELDQSHSQERARASPDVGSKQAPMEKGPHHSVFSLFHVLLGLPESIDRGPAGDTAHLDQFSRHRTEPGEI